MFFIPSTNFSHGTGQDFDMAEYEVLRLDEWDSTELQSQTMPPSESESTPITPSLTPQSSRPSTPSPPPAPPAPEQQGEVGKEVQSVLSSPQLRLIKRKAPEVYASSAWLLSCFLILTAPWEWWFTHWFTNFYCCVAKYIIMVQQFCKCGESGCL